MNTAEKFVSIIAQNFNPQQGWLQEFTKGTVKRKDPSSWLSKSIIRKGKDGGVRNAGISSMASTCERYIAHSLFGVSSYKLDEGDAIDSTRYGKYANDEIDRILRGQPDWVVGNDGEVSNPKPWETHGAVTIKSPVYMKVDKTSRRSFFGVWDYLNTESNEIIELKVTPELPNEPFQRTMNQLALYICATGASGGWAIYLPVDFSTLDPSNPSTYSAFYISLEEAMEISEGIRERIEKTIWKMNWRGNEAMPFLSPAWFYYIVKSAPECDEEWCCSKSNRWHSKFIVNRDWSISKR